MSYVYGPEFYAKTAAGSLCAAERILPLLWKTRSFKSVVDVGCGTGAWLHVARKLGATKVLGVESSAVPDNLLQIQSTNLRIQDLEMPLAINAKFDLCICLEVAEHLSPTRAPSFIHELSSLADAVLFSAAIPFQGGPHHINEQWPEFWAELFQRFGFEVWDGLRAPIWNLTEVPWWYRQNIMLFVAGQLWKKVFSIEPPTKAQTLTRIHPECFLWNKPEDQRTDVLSRLYRYANCRKSCTADY